MILSNEEEVGSSAPQEARASGVIMALIAVYLSWSSVSRDQVRLNAACS
jgi:hypothetical protein